MQWGFCSDEVLNLTLREFDLAIIVMHNVRIRQDREHAYRVRAAQADEKGFKKFIKQYTRSGEAPPGTRTESEFLLFAGSGF